MQAAAVLGKMLIDMKRRICIISIVFPLDRFFFDTVTPRDCSVQ